MSSNENNILFFFKMTWLERSDCVSSKTLTAALLIIVSILVAIFWKGRLGAIVLIILLLSAVVLTVLHIIEFPIKLDNEDYKIAETYIRNLPFEPSIKLNYRTAYRVGDSLVSGAKKVEGGAGHAVGDPKPHCAGKGGLNIDKNYHFVENKVVKSLVGGHNGSLLSYICKNKDKNDFYENFTEFFKNKGPGTEELKDTAVIHLRLGDKLVAAKKTGAFYDLPFPVDIEKRVFPILKERGVKKLRVLIGIGYPFPWHQWSISSSNYLSDLMVRAEKANFEVILKQGSPDEDLALLCKAPFVVMTSGGYAVPAAAYNIGKKNKTFITMNKAKADLLRCVEDERTDDKIEIIGV